MLALTRSPGWVGGIQNQLVGRLALASKPEGGGGGSRPGTAGLPPPLPAPCLDTVLVHGPGVLSANPTVLKYGLTVRPYRYQTRF